MLKSLLVKLGLLSVTVGVIVWVRWAPQPPAPGIPSATEKPILVSQASVLEGQESRPAGSSSRNVQGPNLAAVTQTEASNTALRSGLDLNRASADELESLPGIGTVLAQRVIAFRESVGRFQKIEDLREVKGIGAKTFERLRPFVTVLAANS